MLDDNFKKKIAAVSFIINKQNREKSFSKLIIAKLHYLMSTKLEINSDKYEYFFQSILAQNALTLFALLQEV